MGLFLRTKKMKIELIKVNDIKTFKFNKDLFFRINVKANKILK